MPQEKRENFFTELLKFALIAIVIVVPVRLFVAQPFIVSGASMVPTFQNGQYLIIDELTYHVSQPQRGDVVVFRYPKDPSQFFIKRVIGLPGETVIMKDSSVAIEKTDLPAGRQAASVVLDEPYVVNRGNGTKTLTLGVDEYFVLGDNRPESSDSRVWGTLPRANIVGRVLVRLLPLQFFGVFPGAIAQPQ
ncbi:MAG: signal peptidase I [bacterium]|nr:signal peptidase I [bacterium]